LNFRKTDLPQALNLIGQDVVDAAFTVHKILGPGLFERIYEASFCFELVSRGYEVGRQVPLPIVYKGVNLGEGYRLDVLINHCVICELKADSSDSKNGLWQTQLLTYMKLKKIQLGFIINFNESNIGKGITRMVLR